MTKGNYFVPLIGVNVTCSACGTRLPVRLKEQRETEEVSRAFGSDAHVEGMMFHGDDKSYYPTMFRFEVMPCKSCIDKELEPARRIKQAFDAIAAQEKNDG